MMLTDTQIRAHLDEDIHIDPSLHDSQIQPVSIDLRLGEDESAAGWIYPREFLLGSTLENVRLSSQVAGQVHGKSTLARKGLIVEAAGLVDPGFDGQLTLELFNMSDGPIRLQVGMLICQISFVILDRPVGRAYGDAGLQSHYQFQQGPTQAWS